MTDLPALDDLMTKFRERMLAEPVTADSTNATSPQAAIDARIAEIRTAILSQQGAISRDTMARFGQKLEADKQAKALTSPKGLRRLFPGLR